ncbi:hypothetical protein P8822_00415 [Bacillus sonorensis]|uniref:hypothetical protein n=1 Tax=Bacillus subtilis group TaxID=653685 RepID=UPI001FD70455|nr:MULTISPECIES: hypothetical protein [Bacillus subtilis group]MCJ8223653.1 hypothetical protein [Bacillus paralicheniformis]MEC0526276.1 hypothetical protein [Bacillus sonorensis]
MEGSAMELVKMYVTVFFIFALFSAGAYLININQANDFKQYVNYQIERNGGLTESAMGKISDYNEEHYHGRFNVVSSQGSRKMPFGEEVDYTIKGKYEFFFISLPVQLIHVKGSAVSMIR